MRLLNTSTLELESFFGRELPIYAILSHTWGDEEVTLQDMAHPTEAEKKAGFAKMRGCCDKAAEDGYSYVWIDTCCIDKTSSAELSEAINSMYMWYKNSDLCYAYLSDVDVVEFLDKYRYGKFQRRSCFEDSRWFKRGWTLQELIAPRTVEFYTSGWEEIGTKQSLSKVIADVTGIDLHVLAGRDPSEYHVAERMSWAASRKTTRIEDISYCLLGVFKIHMPLLYGEGSRAFIRLQEEILRTTDDYTILARGFHQSLQDPRPLRVSEGSRASRASRGPIPLSWNSPLATSISDFSADCPFEGLTYRNLVKDSHISTALVSNTETASSNLAPYPLLLTAKGLYITLPMRKVSQSISLAYLHCKLRQLNSLDRFDQIICMALTEVSPGHYQMLGIDGHSQQNHELMPHHALSSFRTSTFYIKQEYSPPLPRNNLFGPGIPMLKIQVSAPAACRVFDSEACSSDEFIYIREVTHPIPRVRYPEILCVLWNGDKLLVKVGNTGAWPSGGNWWCHCFLDPEKQTKEAWGSHLSNANSLGRTKRWSYFPDFVPDNPTDRLRATLPTVAGIVSVSIREYPPRPDQNLERRVITKIRIEKI